MIKNLTEEYILDFLKNYLKAFSTKLQIILLFLLSILFIILAIVFFKKKNSKFFSIIFIGTSISLMFLIYDCYEKYFVVKYSLDNKTYSIVESKVINKKEKWGMPQDIGYNSYYIYFNSKEKDNTMKVDSSLYKKIKIGDIYYLLYVRKKDKTYLLEIFSKEEYKLYNNIK